MGTPLQFDYYYGAEAEQFRFFRIPKMLFEKSYFKPLSCESKLLYGVLLDQVSLSLKNGWVDEQNRTYIIFTVESVTDTIGCSRDKARKLMMELEEIGLIEKKRRGQGRPDIIYVKNFVRLIAEKTGKVCSNRIKHQLHLFWILCYKIVIIRRRCKVFVL